MVLYRSEIACWWQKNPRIPILSPYARIGNGHDLEKFPIFHYMSTWILYVGGLLSTFVHAVVWKIPELIKNLFRFFFVYFYFNCFSLKKNHVEISGFFQNWYICSKKKSIIKIFKKDKSSWSYFTLKIKYFFKIHFLGFFNYSQYLNKQSNLWNGCLKLKLKSYEFLKLVSTNVDKIHKSVKWVYWLSHLKSYPRKLKHWKFVENFILGKFNVWKQLFLEV
jgi:hypothetical protein